MPKMKTNRSAAKRLRRTASGKLKHKRAFLRHNLSGKTTKRKRQLRRPEYTGGADQKRLEALLPYGA